MTIQLEAATSPFLIPTTTLNLKSPPPLCQAYGEYPLWVKPGKLRPPSPPQLQPPVRHPPSQHEAAVSTGCHPGPLLAPPLGAVLFSAPQIPAGMTGFWWNGTGIRRNGTRIHRNDRILPEWHQNDTGILLKGLEGSPKLT